MHYSFGIMNYTYLWSSARLKMTIDNAQSINPLVCSRLVKYMKKPQNFLNGQTLVRSFVPYFLSLILSSVSVSSSSSSWGELTLLLTCSISKLRVMSPVNNYWQCNMLGRCCPRIKTLQLMTSSSMLTTGIM